MKKNKLEKIKAFDELLDIKYGKTGTKTRNEFEKRAKKFLIKELKKDEKKNSKK